MTIDLLINETTDDIVFVNGDFSLATTNIQNVRQRIETTLKTFLGEWALNVQFGIPYRQSIFTKVRNKEELDAIFISATSAVPGVTEILRFDSEFPRGTRQYTISLMEVRTTEGETVRVTEFSPDNFIYPTPPTTSTSLCSVT